MSRGVVLTGASSFVGLHLGLAFAEAGWEVTAVHGRPIGSYDGVQAERLKLLAERCHLVEADLRMPEAAARLAEAAAPCLWLQHAGYATGYASPNYDLRRAAEVNLLALPPLYRALAGGDCGVIVTGSSMEYATSDLPNREDEACWPDSPYGLSKLSETLLARQLALRFAVPTRVARLYIPFGGLDNPAKLLSQAAEALRGQRPIDLSPCHQLRDFVAVEEVCDGYLRLAADLPRGLFDIINLGSGVATALRDLLLSLAAATGADPGLLRFGAIPMRPGEPPVSYGDIAKAKSLLGWSPRPPVETAAASLGLV